MLHRNHQIKKHAVISGATTRGAVTPFSEEFNDLVIPKTANDLLSETKLDI
jgi:hypothetical protein